MGLCLEEANERFCLDGSVRDNLLFGRADVELRKRIKNYGAVCTHFFVVVLNRLRSISGQQHVYFYCSVCSDSVLAEGDQIVIYLGFNGS